MQIQEDFTPRKEAFVDFNQSLDVISATSSAQASPIGIEDQIGFVICLSETEAIAITLRSQFYYFNATTNKQTSLRVKQNDGTAFD